MRNGLYRHPHDVGDIADAEFFLAQTIHDLRACLIAQCFEQRTETVSAMHFPAQACNFRLIRTIDIANIRLLR